MIEAEIRRIAIAGALSKAPSGAFAFAFGLRFTVYSLQFTVYSLQFTVYCLQFTVYSLQFFDLKVQSGKAERTVYGSPNR